MTVFQAIRNERGAAVILTALALSLLIGFCAVVVDVGLLYVSRAQLTNVTDAAALAGALELPGDADAAKQAAESYAAQNGKPGDAIVVTVANDHFSLSVHAHRNVELLFARIFGLDFSTVSASAKAAIQTASSANGVVPFGVVKQDFIFGQLYTLKQGAGSGYQGNYGALALGDTGASNYYNNIVAGYQGKIKIGDWLTTETGNMVGPTGQGVHWRINQDPASSYDSALPSSSRIVVIPVIDSLPGNGRGEVLAVGLAAFYLEDVGGGGSDNLVTGRFLRMVVSGDATDGAGYGLYTARLVE